MDDNVGEVRRQRSRRVGPRRRGGRGSQTTTWVTCIVDDAGGVALVKEVSEVGMRVMWTWTTWVTCVVDDVGRVALVEEGDEAAR